MRLILIFLGLISIASAEYLRNDNIGVIQDTQTNLLWQDNEVVSNKTWTEAIDYCETLALGNYNDWRLPNYNEIESTIDTSRNAPAMSPVFESTVTTVEGKYWTSTTNDDSKVEAWTLQTRNGWTYHDEKSAVDTNLYVRCVRDGQ